MAISGSGGWIPSNQVRLADDDFWFCGITQNKPKSICNNDVDDVVRRLLAGETVTIDVREAFTRQVRKKLYAHMQQLRTESGEGAFPANNGSMQGVPQI